MRCFRINFVVSIFTLSFALVTSPYSQVLQAPDLAGTNKINIKCKNACKVYVDRPYDNLVITQNEKTIVNFKTIVSSNLAAPAGYELPPSDEYFLENKGEPNPSFVFYVVEKQAPIFGAPVYAPQEKLGISFSRTDRYFTFLSSFEAVEFYGFTGLFPDGYPRIYATGFDAAGDARCRPVYQARDQYMAERSWPAIPTAVFTVDFGYEGAHNVSVSQRNAKNPMKGGGLSTVYTSPGYYGCSFTDSPQNYYSALNNVVDQFTLAADRLDIDAVYDLKSAVEGIEFNVNSHENIFVGTGSYKEHYDKSSFNVFLSWYRQSPGSSWSMQLDLGSAEDSSIRTTTKSGRSLSVLSALIVAIATLTMAM